MLIAADADRSGGPFRLDGTVAPAPEAAPGGRVRQLRQIELPEEIRWQDRVSPQTEQTADAP
jgi:hypothetical protein